MVYQCYTETIHTIYLTLTFVYLAILQIIGIVLAIQTRKIKIKLLNDSKYISAVIYISSIALFFIGSNVLIPDQFINIEEALFSGSILVGTTCFLALIFIPKVINAFTRISGYIYVSVSLVRIVHELCTGESNWNYIYKGHTGGHSLFAFGKDW